MIVVEHWDRQARFRRRAPRNLSVDIRPRLVVLDPQETADDLVRDITEVLTSMCARPYGRRVAKNRAGHAAAVMTGKAAG